MYGAHSAYQCTGCTAYARSIQESKSLIESEEECLMAMRISVAAVLVLQSYVRAVLVRRHEEGWVPPYLRKGWVPPTPAEFDERLAALGARFPAVIVSLPTSTLLPTSPHSPSQPPTHDHHKLDPPLLPRFATHDPRQARASPPCPRPRSRTRCMPASATQATQLRSSKMLLTRSQEIKQCEL